MASSATPTTPSVAAASTAKPPLDEPYTNEPSKFSLASLRQGIESANKEGDGQGTDDAAAKASAAGRRALFARIAASANDEFGSIIGDANGGYVRGADDGNEIPFGGGGGGGGGAIIGGSADQLLLSGKAERSGTVFGSMDELVGIRGRLSADPAVQDAVARGDVDSVTVGSGGGGGGGGGGVAVGFEGEDNSGGGASVAVPIRRVERSSTVYDDSIVRYANTTSPRLSRHAASAEPLSGDVARRHKDSLTTQRRTLTTSASRHSAEHGDSGGDGGLTGQHLTVLAQHHRHTSADMMRGGTQSAGNSPASQHKGMVRSASTRIFGVSTLRHGGNRHATINIPELPPDFDEGMLSPRNGTMSYMEDDETAPKPLKAEELKKRPDENPAQWWKRISSIGFARRGVNIKAIDEQLSAYMCLQFRDVFFRRQVLDAVVTLTERWLRKKAHKSSSRRRPPVMAMREWALEELKAVAVVERELVSPR